MNSKIIYVLIISILVLMSTYVYQSDQNQKLKQEQLFLKRIQLIEQPLKEKIDSYFLTKDTYISDFDVFIAEEHGRSYSVCDTKDMPFRFSLYKQADRECESFFDFNTQNKYWYQCKAITTSDIARYWSYKVNDLSSLAIQRSADVQNNSDMIKIIDSDKTTVLKIVKLPYRSYPEPEESMLYDFNSIITMGWVEYY